MEKSGKMVPKGCGKPKNAGDRHRVLKINKRGSKIPRKLPTTPPEADRKIDVQEAKKFVSRAYENVKKDIANFNPEEYQASKNFTNDDQSPQRDSDIESSEDEGLDGDTFYETEQMVGRDVPEDSDICFSPKLAAIVKDNEKPEDNSCNGRHEIFDLVIVGDGDVLVDSSSGDLTELDANPVKNRDITTLIDEKAAISGEQADVDKLQDDAELQLDDIQHSSSDIVGLKEETTPDAEELKIYEYQTASVVFDSSESHIEEKEDVKETETSDERLEESIEIVEMDLSDSTVEGQIEILTDSGRKETNASHQMVDDTLDASLIFNVPPPIWSEVSSDGDFYESPLSFPAVKDFSPDSLDEEKTSEYEPAITDEPDLELNLTFEVESAMNKKTMSDAGPDTVVTIKPPVIPEKPLATTCPSSLNLKQSKPVPKSAAVQSIVIQRRVSTPEPYTRKIPKLNTRSSTPKPRAHTDTPQPKSRLPLQNTTRSMQTAPVRNKYSQIKARVNSNFSKKGSILKNPVQDQPKPLTVSWEKPIKQFIDSACDLDSTIEQDAPLEALKLEIVRPCAQVPSPTKSQEIDKEKKKEIKTPRVFRVTPVDKRLLQQHQVELPVFAPAKLQYSSRPDDPEDVPKEPEQLLQQVEEILEENKSSSKVLLGAAAIGAIAVAGYTAFNNWDVIVKKSESWLNNLLSR